MIHFKSHDYELWVDRKSIDGYGRSDAIAIDNTPELCWIIISGERYYVDYTLKEIKGKIELG